MIGQSPGHRMEGGRERGRETEKDRDRQRQRQRDRLCAVDSFLMFTEAMAKF